MSVMVSLRSSIVICSGFASATGAGTVGSGATAGTMGSGEGAGSEAGGTGAAATG